MTHILLPERALVTLWSAAEGEHGRGATGILDAELGGGSAVVVGVDHLTHLSIHNADRAPAEADTAAVVARTPSPSVKSPIPSPS
ncbi:hypothetical protein GCM10010357_43870 [Streptomyces luteireticuli]|uniref:Uncharacterized protein n=1 Tax=Streptomyces luteireticuli TaxID=173858 RepID=A0ABN0YXD9_9ACTN